MSKYIDLSEKILDSWVYVTANDALRWLDEHPEQAPGRTITESDYSDITEWARNYSNRGWEGRRVLAGAGITIIPDPVQTNVEKLEAHLLDLLGVVEAIGNVGVHNMAYELDRAGVKAPGGDDE